MENTQLLATTAVASPSGIGSPTGSPQPTPAASAPYPADSIARPAIVGGSRLIGPATPERAGSTDVFRPPERVTVASLRRRNEPLTAAAVSLRLSRSVPQLAAGGSLTLVQLHAYAQNPTTSNDVKNAYNALIDHPDWTGQITNQAGTITPLTIQRFNEYAQGIAAPGMVLDTRMGIAKQNFHTGDCAFLAVIRGLAEDQNHQAQLRELITPVLYPSAKNPQDYAYNVRFPGDLSGRTYTVTEKDLTQAAALTTGGHGTVAVARSDDGHPIIATSSGDKTTQILELAAAQFSDQPNSLALVRGFAPSQIQIRGNVGVYPLAAMALLTGQTGRFTTKKDFATLFAADGFAVAPTVAGINFDGYGAVQPPPHNAAHTVTLIYFDRTNDTVTFENPYDPSRPVTIPRSMFEILNTNGLYHTGA